MSTINVGWGFDKNLAGVFILSKRFLKNKEFNMAATGVMISQAEGITYAAITTPSITEGSAIDILSKELYKLVDEYDYKMLVVDFQKVHFLSSRMISTLTMLHKKSTAIDGKVIMCNMRPELMKVFQITKLDKLLNFAKDEKAATKKFKSWGLL